MAQLLAGLAEGHRLGVICLRDLGQLGIDEGLRDRCEIVEEVPWVDGPRSLPRRLRHRLGVLGARLGGLPAWPAHFPTRAFEERVRRVLQDWSPDIVQLEFTVMGHFLAALEGYSAPVVLSYHMPGEDASSSGGPGEPWWLRADRYVDRLAWRRFDARVLRRVDAIVAFSERDRNQLSRMSGLGLVRQAQATLPVPPTPLSPLGEPPLRIVFVGHFAHPPNVHAAERLVARVLPLVRRRYPEVSVQLVGAGPPPRLRALAGPAVQVTGRVSSVASYLNAAALVVAPLVSGSGVRIKVLEALAAGKAVVASGLAVQGIPVSHGDQVILAESDEEFAQAIIGLLAAPEERAALAARAYSWARRTFRRDTLAATYESLYEELLNSDRALLPQPASSVP